MEAKSLNWMGRTLVWGAMGLIGAAGAAHAQSTPMAPAGAADGFTQPYAKRDIAPATSGTVAEVPIKRGDTVKPGDLLIRLDTRAEEKQRDIYQLEAKSRVRIEAAEAERDLNKFKMDQVQELRKTDASSEIELQEAKLAYIQSLNQVKLAEHEFAKSGLELQRQVARMELMETRSPADIPQGIVERVEVGAGEVADPQRPVLRIVQTDPLKIAVPNLRPEEAESFKVGDTVQVRYPDEQESRSAKVTYVAATVDVGSGTREVGLEMSNPDNRPPGLPVYVQIPAAAAAGESVSQSN